MKINNKLYRQIKFIFSKFNFCNIDINNNILVLKNGKYVYVYTMTLSTNHLLLDEIHENNFNNIKINLENYLIKQQLKYPVLIIDYGNEIFCEEKYLFDNKFYDKNDLSELILKLNMKIF